MTAQPERLVRNAIVDWLRMHRIMCWIFDSVGIFDPNKRVYLTRSSKYKIKGLPDIHGILPGGRFLGVEVKQPDRVNAKGQTVRYYPSAEQKERIAEINAAGGLAFVARSIEDMESRKAELGIGRGA